jgi:hypothetical protein
MAQVGGSHYVKRGIQPWDVVAEYYGLNFWLGNVVKYVLREQDKHGLEDLKKARHYLDYEIERREQQERIALLDGGENGNQ